jgi:K319L-like, PKD domain
MTIRTLSRLFFAVLPLLALLACESGGDPTGTKGTNTPPSADAGPDLSANVGELVQLHGTGTDADGDNLTHSWTFVSRPAGSSAILNGASNASTSFTPDVAGEYVVRLAVSDGTSSRTDDCIISVNAPPVANAGPDQQVGVGEVVQLDGTGSNDPDGNGALTYLWSFVTRPNGSQATLSDPTSPTPTFTADVEGTFDTRLVVSDGKATSQPDQMTVTAALVQTQLFLRYQDPNDFLSTQQETSGSTRITLYDYGSGQSTDFVAILGNALAGTQYGAIMWLGAGTGSGQTGSWTVTILIEQNGVQNSLATHTFTVPYNTSFIRYTADFTGQSGGVAGDKIIVRLTLNGVSRGAVLFGAGDLDSSVKVPGNVTVTPAPSSAGARAEESSGVRVEVTADHSLRYSGG